MKKDKNVSIQEKRPHQHHRPQFTTQINKSFMMFGINEEKTSTKIDKEKCRNDNGHQGK